MSVVEEVLSRLSGVQKNGRGWKALCPCPAHRDSQPSLSIHEGEDSRALLKCFAGCGIEEIVAALGLEMRDLFEGGGGSFYPSNAAASVHRSPQTPKGNDEKTDAVPGASPGTDAASASCTLEGYATAKGLPAAFLKKLRLKEFTYQGSPAVRIPYLNEDGSESAVRFRTALEKSSGEDDRFRWKSGSKTTLYGLWRLEKVREAGYAVLVEGESDAQTLWYRGIPALGIPGSSTFRSEWSERLEGVEKVYAVIEPDHGGEKLWERLAASPLRERLYRVELGDAKDVSELYLTDPDCFKEKLESALEGAAAWLDIAESETRERRREAFAESERLAGEPDILGKFAGELAASGVAGESRLAKLLYLAVTSRLLRKPVSVVVKGPSSGGKSYLVEKVLGFMPESAFYALTAMSEHALAYSTEPLSHRHLVIYEAAGLNSDFQSYLIRSLLSEGRVRYETVEKTSEGLVPRLIEREGPTGLLITTTLTKLHPENETRMLSLTVADSRSQTRDVLARLASEDGDYSPDKGSWYALQNWIATGECRVSIPYAGMLSELVFWHD